MVTIGKMVLSLFLLVCMAAAPLACVSVNRSPDDNRPADNQPKTEVNVGGEHGVTVEHPSD